MRGGAAVLLSLGLLVAGCASPPPPRPGPVPEHGSRVHVVRRGENLWRISQRYGTTVDAIARANGIRDVTRLRVGQRLWIPPGNGVARPATAAILGSSDPRGRANGRNAFEWPVRGKVTSAFGMRSRAHHDGIDISAPPGTPVHAAEAGRVVHSDDDLSGYGNLIIIKHAGSFSTVYAHNRRNLVRAGEFVEKGEVIAEVGRTGRASAPHLHFEVRRNGSARNPLDYLP